MTSKVSWEESKGSYLQMSLEEKRTHYRTKQYISLENIETWSEYAGKNVPLLESIQIATNNHINNNMNTECVGKVSIFRGDVTQLEVDAIVNATHPTLFGAGGVDKAIHRSAGHLLLKECRTFKKINFGQTKLSGGYKLPAKYIIHTVGPRGEKPEILKLCYKNSLKIALEHKLRTIAFPCISTGVSGYPLEAATHIALMEVRKQLEANPDKFSRLIFCVFTENDENVYTRLLQSYFPVN